MEHVHIDFSGIAPEPAAHSHPERGNSAFLESLEMQLREFDVATADNEHEVLRIDMPHYLHVQDALPEALRNKSMRIRLEYDGKVLAFDVYVAEDERAPAAARITPDGMVQGHYTLAVLPVLNASQARGLVGMLLRYSRARKLHLNSH